eukprot:gene10776-11929_t
MGIGNSFLSHGFASSSSRRQKVDKSLSCVLPRRRRTQRGNNNEREEMEQTKVVIFSQCSTNYPLQCAVSLIENNRHDLVRVHATTDNYDNIQLLDDNVLLKYLNKKLFIHKMDIGDKESIDKVIMQILEMESRIDTLVCYTDELSMGLADACNDTCITRSFDNNFFSYLILLQSVIPVFKERKSGQIILINTIAGMIGIPNYSIYCAARFAIENLFESLASECQPHGIKFSVIQIPLRKTFDNFLHDHHLTTLHQLDNKENDHGASLQNNKLMMTYDAMKHIIEDVKVKKLGNCIMEVIRTQKPYYRYSVNKECTNIIKRKVQEFRGTETINEVCRFFLHIDLDEVDEF